MTRTAPRTEPGGPAGSAGHRRAEAAEPAERGRRAATAELQVKIAELQHRVTVQQARIGRLEWQVAVLKAGRLARLSRLVRDARRDPQRIRHLPRRAVGVLRTPIQPPPAPPAKVAPYVAPLQLQRQLLAMGEYEQVIDDVGAILAENPADVMALDLLSKAHWRRGDVHDSLAVIRRMRAAGDSVKLADRERGLLGRARELDPRWLPRIPGPPRPYEPAPDTVLHLFKESHPYRVNGFTMRNRYTLLAQRQAGLSPAVVTSMGFPRKVGVTDFEPVEMFEETPYHRLDLGPDYPETVPDDAKLTDTTWLTARVARELRSSVIHASAGYRGYETGLVGLALRQHLRRPLVYEIRSFHETTWTNEPRRAEIGQHVELRRAAEKRCMLAADAVITIGTGMRDELIARGIPAEKIHLAPNGVDAEVFVPREPPADLRDRYGLTGRAVIGYVSNLDHEREGHEVLIDATAVLRAAGRDVVCLIVGAGGRREGLEAHARGAGVADRVVFTGAVPHDEIQDMYALIDVFVVPRIDEHAARLVTPLKPFEAMAMERAVVVADLPALVEVVEPGTRGLAFPPGDFRALARRVEDLMDDPDLARRLAAEGRRWVTAERTWRSNGPRYRAVYSEVLADWERAERDGQRP